MDVIFPLSTHENSVRRIHSFPLAPSTLIINTSYPVYALAPYRSAEVRALITQMKYKRDNHASALIAQALGETLLELVSDAEQLGTEVIITYVPSSLRRIKDRGYDHLALLMQQVLHQYATLAPLVRPRLLIKSVHSASQTKRTYRERLRNVRGTFRIDPTESVQLKRSTQILIIDDVLTTGATMYEIIATLEKSGFHSVSGVVIASKCHTP